MKMLWTRSGGSGVFITEMKHRTLSCLYSEEQREKMRVEACDRCRGYLKVIASFSLLSPEMLFVEDLATMHLDYVAARHRYDSGGTVNEALENIRANEAE